MPRTMTPPQLPAIPDIKPELADYLRRFALWCQNNFNTSVQTNSAATSLLMQSMSGLTVWKVTVDDDGTLHQTQMTPGAQP
jgi:cation diffusion facilitator CzcD-associated flavoprotein CzcO